MILNWIMFHCKINKLYSWDFSKINDKIDKFYARSYLNKMRMMTKDDKNNKIDENNIDDKSFYHNIDKEKFVCYMINH